MVDDPSGTGGGGSNVLVWLCVCLLVAVAGFAIGRLGGEPMARPEPSEMQAVSPGTGLSTEDIQVALADPDPFERAAWLGGHLPATGPGIGETIEQVMRSTRIDRGPVEVDLLIRRWAQVDPESAYRWGFGKVAPSYREAAAATAMYEWAIQAPDAAVRAYEELPEGSTAEIVLDSLVRGWFDGGEPGLVTFIHDLGYSFDRQRALRSMLRAMIRRDGTAAAEQWCEALPDDDERFKRSAIRKLAPELTSVDPALGAAWEEKHRDGPYGESLLTLVAVRWAFQDGPAAMRWLSQAPEGRRRDEAVRDAFRVWRQRQREEMHAWVDEMGIEGVEPWFLPAVGPYAMALSVFDPARAMQWADLIPDEESRLKAQITIARRWRSLDSDAAEAWVVASSLSEANKIAARQPLPVRRASTMSALKKAAGRQPK